MAITPSVKKITLMRTIGSMTRTLGSINFFATVLAVLSYPIFRTISRQPCFSFVPRYTASIPTFFRTIYLALMPKVFTTTVFAISGDRMWHNKYSFNIRNYTIYQKLCQVQEYVEIAEARLRFWAGWSERGYDDPKAILKEAGKVKQPEPQMELEL
jgi:hypothetical protein